MIFDARKLPKQVRLFRGEVHLLGDRVVGALVSVPPKMLGWRSLAPSVVAPYSLIFTNPC